MWVTLNAMGYDYNLVQDEAALFKVSRFIDYYLIFKILYVLVATLNAHESSYST